MNTIYYRRVKLFHELILLLTRKSLIILIVYRNVLICVITLTFAIFANLNIMNACMFINAHYTKKIFVNCLINCAIKRKYYLLFHDFIELA